MAGTCLLWADKNVSFKSVTGWIGIGAAGWLAFMAKPSTALMLAVCVVFYIVAAKKISLKMLLIAVVSAFVLLTCSALWIDGSIAKFIDRIGGAMTLSQLLEGGHTINNIFRVDSIRLNSATKAAIFLIFLIFIVLYFSTKSGLSDAKAGKFIFISTSIGFLFYTIFIVLGTTGEALIPIRNATLLGITLAASVIGFFDRKNTSFKHLALACLFWVLGSKHGQSGCSRSNFNNAR